jgi:hypothetical protein
MERLFPRGPLASMLRVPSPLPGLPSSEGRRERSHSSTGNLSLRINVLDSFKSLVYLNNYCNRVFYSNYQLHLCLLLECALPDTQISAPSNINSFYFAMYDVASLTGRTFTLKSALRYMISFQDQMWKNLRGRRQISIAGEG